MRRLVVVLVALPLALTACGGGSATPSVSPTPTSSSAAPSPTSTDLDCTAVLTAISDYETGVANLAVSLKANDSMSAVAAADAMLYAVSQMMPMLTAAPDAVQGFAARAWAVAALVKSTVAAGTPVNQASAQVAKAFNEPEYVDGAKAIQDYVVKVCPSASPSAS